MPARLNGDADLCIVCLQAPARTEFGICDDCLTSAPWRTDEDKW
jgi:hypothetical protein